MSKLKIIKEDSIVAMETRVENYYAKKDRKILSIQFNSMKTDYKREKYSIAYIAYIIYEIIYKTTKEN